LATGEQSADPIRPGRLERIISSPLQLGRDWFVDFVRLQGFDRAVALAGQAFTALIPLLIVYTAVVSRATGRDFADQLIEVFGLTGSAADSFKRAFAPAGAVESQVSAIGFLLLIGSALSFTRALQRLYQLSWQQPSLGLRAAKWGLIWIGLVIVVLTVRPPMLSWSHGVLRLALSIAFTAAIWLFTPFVLLARRVDWHRLVPTALLTSVGMTALSVCSAVWMPRTVASSAAQFGVIGIAFALLSWLVAAGVVLVLAASGGVVVQGRLDRRRRRRRPADHPEG
jgi:membrane protein